MAIRENCMQLGLRLKFLWLVLVMQVVVLVNGVYDSPWEDGVHGEASRSWKFSGEICRYFVIY